MDLTQYVVLAAIIAGVTELLHRIRAGDVWTSATITAAAIVGGVFGALHYYPNLDVAHGIAAGFAAAGTLTGLGSIGNKSSAQPSTLTSKEGPR